MKKILITLLVIVLSLSGCSPAVKEDKSGENNISLEEAQYNKIGPEKAKEMMDNEELIILDVRTPEEYKEEHIEGALLIPDYDLEKLAESELPDKDEKILVYCRSGQRSKAASEKLLDMGYRNVYDFGGIMDWTYGTVKAD